MTPSRPSATRRYQTLVSKRLSALEDALRKELARLSRRTFSAPTVELCFEVQFDELCHRVPIVGYELAEDGSQTVRVEGKKLLLVAPLAVLRGKRVLTSRELEEFWNANVETLELNASLLFRWFVKGWNRAGLESFPLRASLAVHDEGRRFDLRRKRWIRA